MKDSTKKLLAFVRRHLGGVGLFAVTVPMALTVVKGATGQAASFDPGGIDTSVSSGASGQPDRTGYDLSGEGDASEQVDRQPEQEQEEEEGDGPRLDGSETFREERLDPIILPDGLRDDLDVLDTVDVAAAGGMDEMESGTGDDPQGDPTADRSQGLQDGSVLAEKDRGGRRDREPSSSGGAGNGSQGGTGDSGSLGGSQGGTGDGGSLGGGQGGAGNDGPAGGDPAGGMEDPPGGGDSQDPGTADKAFSVTIGGEQMGFDSEDDALAWIADNKGTNDAGQYFEGFVRDEAGNLVPSYTDKGDFGGTSDGETIWDYTGASSTFVVPDGIKNLELAWLADNDKIKTIVIPKSVVKVIAGDGSRFPSLEKFVVSGDNPYYLSIDGVLYCRGAQGTELCMTPAAKTGIEKWPEDLAVIGANSFYRCRMEQVVFPDTVTVISGSSMGGAFNESSIRTIQLPESVQTIGQMAFSYEDMSEPHRVVVKALVPPAVTGTTFTWMSPSGAVAPTAEIIVPSSADDRIYEDYLTAWGTVLAKQYGGSAALQILKTEDGAQERYEYHEEDGKCGFKRVGETGPLVWQDALGTYRIDEAGGLTLVRCMSTAAVVDLSASGIEAVDEGAFAGCGGMTVIKLPESLRTMPEDSFAENAGLRAVISYGPVPPASVLGAPKDCAVFVKPEALAAYQKEWGGQVRKLLGTADSYSALSRGVVFDSENSRLLDVPVTLESFTLPSYVTTIYDGAFGGNTNLTSISIPARITSVGEGAFAGCTALTTAVWQTPAMVPDRCFEGCACLETFSASGAGHDLTAFGDRAFYGCRALGSVLYYSYLSGGQNYYYYHHLESVGEEAFYGCTSMTYAYLHDSVARVGASAFEGSGLTQLYWYPSAMVPDRCFEDCRALRTVGWGSGLVETIGDRAFYGCRGLSALQLPATVEAIGDQAFDGRGGDGLTLTFASEDPPDWSGADPIDDLVLYVPDSTDDLVYQAYLAAWEGWLGDHPEAILKTKNGAEDRVYGLLDDPSADPARILDAAEADAEEPETEETGLDGSEREEAGETGTEPEKGTEAKDPGQIGDGESGAGVTGPEASDPGEDGPEETGPEGPDPGEDGPEETGPEGPDPGESGPEETGPKDPDPGEDGPEETGPEGPDLGEDGPEETGPEGPDPGEGGPEETGPKDPDPGEDGPEETDPQVSGDGEKGLEGSGPEEPKNEESGPGKPDPGAGSLEEAGPRKPAPGETGTGESDLGEKATVEAESDEMGRKGPK